MCTPFSVHLASFYPFLHPFLQASISPFLGWEGFDHLVTVLFGFEDFEPVMRFIALKVLSNEF
jgi:hypothetical protein